MPLEQRTVVALLFVACAAPGATSRCAKSRAVCWSRRSSSVRSSSVASQLRSSIEGTPRQCEAVIGCRIASIRCRHGQRRARLQQHQNVLLGKVARAKAGDSCLASPGKRLARTPLRSRTEAAVRPRVRQDEDQRVHATVPPLQRHPPLQLLPVARSRLDLDPVLRPPARSSRSQSAGRRGSGTAPRTGKRSTGGVRPEIGRLRQHGRDRAAARQRDRPSRRARVRRSLRPEQESATLDAGPAALEPGNRRVGDGQARPTTP